MKLLSGHNVVGGDGGGGGGGGGVIWRLYIEENNRPNNDGTFLNGLEFRSTPGGPNVVPDRDYTTFVLGSDEGNGGFSPFDAFFVGTSPYYRAPFGDGGNWVGVILPSNIPVNEVSWVVRSVGAYITHAKVEKSTDGGASWVLEWEVSSGLPSSNAVRAVITRPA